MFESIRQQFHQVHAIIQRGLPEFALELRPACRVV
jgi:hypothetical protein